MTDAEAERFVWRQVLNAIETVGVAGTPDLLDADHARVRHAQLIIYRDIQARAKGEKP